MKQIIVSIVLCAAFACSKSEPAKTPEPTAEELAAKKAEDEAAAKKAEEEAAAKKKAEEEAAAKQKEAEELAKTRAEDEKSAQEELARWNDDLRAQVKKLLDGKYKDTKAALTAILKSPHRMPGNADRDAFRHPLETLTFFGIQPSSTVVELGTGGGWYTEILAPLLAKKGKLIITSYDPNGPADNRRTLFGLRTKSMLDKSPELFGNVQVAMIDPPAKLELGAPGTADVVIAIREIHNWVRGNNLEAYLKAAHGVLKPGGVLGIVQHRAAPDAKVEESAQKGYIPEEWLIAEVEKAGFKLAERSEINANPKDTKDYEQGVWTLPPNYAAGDTDRDKYTAIGESDRMTLKFVKVDAPVAPAGEAAAPAGEAAAPAGQAGAPAGGQAPAEKGAETK